MLLIIICAIIAALYSALSLNYDYVLDSQDIPPILVAGFLGAILGAFFAMVVTCCGNQGVKTVKVENIVSNMTISPEEWSNLILIKTDGESKALKITEHYQAHWYSCYFNKTVVTYKVYVPTK